MKILLPVEDQRFAKVILDFIAKHDWPSGPEFRILHVISWTPSDKEMQSSRDLMQYSETQQTEARVLLEQTADKLRELFPSAKIDSEVLTGDPTTHILAVIRAWPADLAIVGSHGRKGVSRFFMGSVSEAIVKNAECGVVVIRHPAVDGERSNTEKLESARI
jgi:nucleotide-binding universal stress UspA family protein